MTQYVDHPSLRGKGGRVDVAELSEDSLDYLASIVRSRPSGRQAANGISAANTILSWCKWAIEREDTDKEAAFLRLFKSDREAAAWLMKSQDRLLKIAGLSSQNLIASDAQATSTQTENDAHDTQAELGQQDQEDAAQAPRR